MRWQKTSFWLAIIGGIAFAVSSVLLWREVTVFNSTSRAYDQNRQRLDNYYGRNPFPSRDNVAAENNNAATIRQWHTTLLTELGRGQIPRRETTAALFQKLFSEKRAEWMVRAKQRGVALAGDSSFAFGFDKYAGGVLPLSEHVQRLTEQLAVVEAIVHTLFEENVSSLVRIGRDEFDVERRERVRGAAAQATDPLAAPAGIATAQADQFEKSRYTIEFVAREPAVVRILNRMASHEVFMVVVRLDIEAASSSVRKAELPSFVEGGAVERPALLPLRSARIVSGPSLENLLKVRVALDVYRFKGDTGA